MTTEYEDLKKDKTSINESHYKGCGIEPVEYINANNLNFFEGNIVKYITRHKEKDKDADIRKVIRYAAMCLKYMYDYTDEEIAVFMVSQFSVKPFSGDSKENKAGDCAAAQ